MQSKTLILVILYLTGWVVEFLGMKPELKAKLQSAMKGKK
jgi:hypothetical protein